MLGGGALLLAVYFLLTRHPWWCAFPAILALSGLGMLAAGHREWRRGIRRDLQNPPCVG